MRWSMVPVSVAAHVAVFVTLMILPLTASVELPTPAPIWRMPEFIQALALPSESETRAPVTRSNRDAAPTEAPDQIRQQEPEPPSTPSGPAVPGALVLPGIASGFGGPGLNVGPVDPPPPPPEPTKKPEPIRPGGVIKEPKKIVGAQPTYPEAARLAKIEGLVIIEAIIDEQGYVRNARVLRSRPLLDEAALTALRQWRYTPTLLNNVPVSVIMTITFNFTLGGDTR